MLTMTADGLINDASGRPLELEIRCPVDSAVLPSLRAVVTSLAGQMGFEVEAVEQIEMAVDEACANVIRHAYKHLGLEGDLSGKSEVPEHCSLWLRLCMGPDRLQIIVIDRGIGINVMPKGHASVEDYESNGAKGGLGIYIIQNFMDEVDYHSPSDSGTVLTMVKYRKPITRHGG